MIIKKNNSDIEIQHKKFYDIIDFLNAGDVLVINETKVTKSKIVGKKPTGTPAEIILEKQINKKTFECRIKGKRLRNGSVFEFQDNLKATILNQNKDTFKVKFNREITEEEMEKNFVMPTPPYIERLPSEKEYQTVYSNKKGSLAAPTAGLHFTKELLKKIEKKGIEVVKICLHVGFGTFLPIRTDIKDHKMHKEYFEISKESAEKINNRKGRLICVGTTSVRSLESSTKECEVNGKKTFKIIPQKKGTEIFIYPGYKFKSGMDIMITNFHFPKSTLILLVSAFFGKKEILKAYKEAIEKKYRFYSLGDSMMLINKN